jgi:Bacterial membrane protein YfhO
VHGAFLRSRSGAVVGLAAVVAVVHARVLFLGSTFVNRDHLTFTVPNLGFLADSLRSGRLPQWCDALGFGTPFLGNPQNQVLYPPAWLAAVLPVGFAADLLALLHLFWAGVGMRAFCVRLGARPAGAFLAGVAFLLAGYTSSMVVMGTALTTLAWLPWIALLTDRVAHAGSWRALASATAWLAGALGAALLAGDPSGVITAGLVALVIALARAPDHVHRGRGLLALLAACVLAAAWTGALVIPALYQLHESQRGAGVSSLESTFWSMRPWRFVEWIIPRAFGDQTNRVRTLASVFAGGRENTVLDPTWASSLYLGFPLVALAVLALRRRDGTLALALGGLLFVALALGVNTPVYGLYRELMILERVVRYPERHLAGAVMLWTALAGIGFDRLFGHRPSRRMLLVLAGGAVLLGVVVILERAFASRVSAHFDSVARAHQQRLRADLAVAVALAGGLSAFAVAAAVALAAAARRSAARVAPLSPVLAAGAILLGLAVEARVVLPLVDRTDVGSLPALLEPLASTPRDYPGEKGVRPRLFGPQNLPLVDPALPAAQEARVYHACAGENTAMPFGFAHVPGYQPGRMGSARIDRFFRKVPVIADAFDVRYLIMPTADLPLGPKRVITTMRPMSLVETARVRPRAYVAPRWSWRPTDEAALDGFYPQGIDDVGGIRLVGNGPPTGAERQGVAPSRCGIEVSRPEDVLLRCDSPLGGYAVLLDEWAPGWTATVDGQPAAIERVDALFRAVAIDRGAHQVRLRYSTPGLGAGVAASLVTLVLLLVLALLRDAPAAGATARSTQRP